MRLTLKGKQGTPAGQVVLTRVRFSGDSVLGRDPKGLSLAWKELIRVAREDLPAYAKRLNSWGFSLPQEFLAPK